MKEKKDRIIKDVTPKSNIIKKPSFIEDIDEDEVDKPTHLPIPPSDTELPPIPEPVPPFDEPTDVLPPFDEPIPPFQPPEEKPSNAQNPNFEPVVYISMQHTLPPIKVKDLFEYYDGEEGKFVYLPHVFKGKEKEYIDSRYRGTSLITINDLIEEVGYKYFSIVDDIFVLFGNDYKDETLRRNYEPDKSIKTFLYVLKETLNEFCNYEAKILMTRLDWLKLEGIEDTTSNRHKGMYLYKYRFLPNWDKWMRGDPCITEDKVILPFKAIIEQEMTFTLNSNVRYAQDWSNQTFYTFATGQSLCSYICEYPMIYSFTAEGKFTNMSAIFEIKDIMTFKMLLAKNIAYYVKRNLEMIQLPGNLVNYNFDSLIQELTEKLEGRLSLTKAEFFSNYWNSHSYNK